jgi:serpin B
MPILPPWSLARRRAAATVICLGAAAACRPLGDTPARAADLPAEAPAPDAPAATYDAFGFALLGRLAADAPGRNAVISPASAGLALAMALEGAAGDTHDSLAATLGLRGGDAGAVAAQNGALLRALRDAPEVSLAVANAMWGRADVRFDPAFLSRVRGGYGAEVAALDLSTPAALARINAWASAATRGKVPQLLAEPAAPDVALVLTNAVYFKGRWASAFAPEQTAERTFHLADGTTRARSMMAQEGDFGYAVGEGFRLARLPYRGGQFSLYVLLPDSGQSLATLTDRLTAARFRAAVAAAAPRPLALVLPRFTLACAADLRLPVAALGAGNAFDPDRADFRRLLAPSHAGMRRVWLSRALQRSVIEVNEEGTEAAAATAVETSVDSAVAVPPVPFTVDHPFVFAIRHDPTGALLFVGRVTDPAGDCGSQ